MRIACLHVPDFPLAAWLRGDSDLRGGPAAVTEGEGPRSRVVALSPEAVRNGARIGMSAAQAAAIDQNIVFRPSSRDVEESAQAALRDVACSHSPRVEDAGAGVVYLDCEGLEALYGEERKLGQGLVSSASRVGLDLKVGIASSRVTARVAAQNGNGVKIVPQGEERRFLAPLPVEVLEPSSGLLKRLGRWGIRTLGDLAALPASAVNTRLGTEGALLACQARVGEERPLLALPTPIRFEESAELDHGVENLEAFGFVLRALLDRLTARLSLRGFLCGDLRLTLQLANHSCVERTVRVVVPGNDLKALQVLVRLRLEACPPPVPIEAVRIEAVAERLRPAQLDLFRPVGPAPERLAFVLARLSALCGSDRIGVPAVVDSHQPDAYEMLSLERLQVAGCRFQVPGSRFEVAGAESETLHTMVALRAVRPPQPVEVVTEHGRLDFVRPLAGSGMSAQSSRKTQGYGYTGHIVRAAGPWRIEGAWWSEGAFSRVYYDVQLSDGVIYRLFYETAWQSYFVDGVYD